MKIGVDAPWYNDSVERVAFNLYAMDYQRLDDIAESLGDVDEYTWEEVQDYFNLNDNELSYVRERVQE